MSLKEEDTMNKGKGYVYFYYDNEKKIIYVGKANDVGQRWRGHREPWMNEVVQIGVRTYDSRVDMDIAERYYIAKLCPKYNKVGTAYGKTSLFFDDKSILEVFTVKAFKEKFLQKDGKQLVNSRAPRKPKVKLSLKEQLIQSGVTILEAEKMNLFEADILSMDLDNVCIKYKNIYLVPRYTPFRSRYKRKKDEDSGFRTNRHFETLRDFIFDDRTKVWNSDDGDVAYCMRSCTKEIAEILFACGPMFSLYVTNAAGEEIIWASNSNFRCLTLRDEYCILECKAENEESFYRFSRNEFTLDMKKIYNQYEHLLNS